MTHATHTPGTETEPPIFGSTAQLVTGFVFLVLGGLLAGVGAANDDGWFIFLIGAVLAIAGQTMLAIGVIAKGVGLGNRES